ncbi:hypothetical protein CXB51_023950 [Gossypium anomalum]|uniref:DUF7745 domain-containing protein n=1 Tax=Gossypium anomalum TaxID=47600 RepID=A0A8J5YD50_9ROSI|nr:hypothetical protein CXB51_023950 [Gossypium anomalum]
MRNEYLNKVEDNASVCTWSEKIQLEKRDSVTEGYMSEFWDFTRVNSTQNELQELRNICTQWDDEVKQLFYQNYGDLPFLLDVKVDRHLFRAMVQFWNPAFSCFTFGDVDLVPTLEEYITLLRCPKIQGHKTYVRPANLPTFAKKLVMITGMSEQWAIARIQQKRDSKCIPWVVLRDLILTHLDVKKKVDVLALGIYGMVIFPKALGHIDEAVADLFDRLGKQNTPVPAILAETKLDKVPCRVFFEGYSPLKEAVDKPKRDDISEERWIDILQNLREEDIMWKAPWLVPSEILYRCGNFDWILLPGIWGAIGYTPLLVLRQYRARQFIPATQGLAQSDFSYKGDHYKKRMREIFEAWKKPFCIKILTEGSTSTLKYKGWFSRRVNDNVLRLTLGVAQSLEESLRVIPSEVEVMKQEFKRKNSELEKRMEKLEEKNVLESRCRHSKDERKSSEQWQHEIQEERVKAEYWEKKFQEMQSRNQTLEKENQGLKVKVTELGRSLHHHQSRNSVIELKASLDKIEEMKHHIGGLETALQDCELRIEQFEVREDQWKGKLHHLQNQVGDRDHVMGEALVQIREVAEHLQELAIQARTLSMMYESLSNKGRELALLLDRVKTLGLRFLKATDKGKAPMAVTGEEGEDHPPGFTPPPMSLQAEAPPRRPSVNIRPQHGLIDTGIHMNFLTGSGFNLGDNPTNPLIPDLDVAKKEDLRAEAAKQFEERC